MNANANTLIGLSPPIISELTQSRELWTTTQAAQYIGRSERTVRRLLQQRVLNGFKVPGRCGEEWRVEPFALEEFKLSVTPQCNELKSNLGAPEIFCADPKKLDEVVTPEPYFSNATAFGAVMASKKSSWNIFLDLLRTLFSRLFVDHQIEN